MKAKRTGTILDSIVKQKAERLMSLKEKIPFKTMRMRAEAAPAPKDFRSAVKRKEHISLIAEIKKTSPIKGVLREEFEPGELASAYEQAGASSLSVVTEEDFFCGSPDYINAARRMSTLPLLRKDFIFDLYQIYESRTLGADAVLLITSIVEKERLSTLMRVVGELCMDALVEVHTTEEIEMALDCGADIIGINSRDLKTMRVDIPIVERLVGLVPSGVVVVAESGVRSREDVWFLDSLGVDAVLVGEAIVTAADVGSKICSLFGEER